jgi:alginate O-acetyltransferase complex protein AlgI
MQFDSFTFIVFFAAVLSLNAWLSGAQAKKHMLLFASLLFYAGWNPWFLPLLLITSSFDFYLGKQISAAPDQTRWRWLLLSLVSNLGVLAYFKYRYFIAGNIDGLFGTELLASLKADTRAWVLPVGISFYTFQSMSYCIDCYRRQVDRHVSWLDFTLYVAFFPQLVAGPIVRFSDFYPQLQALGKGLRVGADALGMGVLWIAIGMFLKIVLADSIFAPASDAVFTAKSVAELSWSAVATATIAFSGQIFCDFAGYSLCAIGAARALGFRLMDNFNAPYAAIGFSDFWRRWHISLSTWLRDYLYIPLGGNRFGVARTYVALSLTMLLGGLWHGAAWTFVIWGALHGAYLVIERALRPWLTRLQFPGAKMLAWLLTLLAVMAAWIFFRAQNVDQALQLLHVLSSNPLALPAAASQLVWWAFAGLLIAHVAERRYALSSKLSSLPSYALTLLLASLLTAIALSPGNSRAFIYFQF